MKKTLLLLSVLVLGACGLRPIYGSYSHNPATATALNNVAIGNIADREGQMLRNRLIDRMYVGGRPKKPTTQLEVILSTTDVDVGLQKDATTSRREHTLTANYTLKDLAGAVLQRGVVRGIVSYNKLDAQYATVAAQQNATDRAVNEVAEQLVNSLALYFAEKATANAKKP